jgi:hypothetical protein
MPGGPGQGIVERVEGGQVGAIGAQPAAGHGLSDQVKIPEGDAILGGELADGVETRMHNRGYVRRRAAPGPARGGVPGGRYTIGKRRGQKGVHPK